MISLSHRIQCKISCQSSDGWKTSSKLPWAGMDSARKGAGCPFAPSGVLTFFLCLLGIPGGLAYCTDILLARIFFYWPTAHLSRLTHALFVPCFRFCKTGFCLGKKGSGSQETQFSSLQESGIRKSHWATAQRLPYWTTGLKKKKRINASRTGRPA